MGWWDDFLHAFCQGSKNGMLSHAMKPITGVAIIGFTTMDDGVEVTAITVFDALRDGMCLVQMIIPQVNERAG